MLKFTSNKGYIYLMVIGLDWIESLGYIFSGSMCMKLKEVPGSIWRAFQLKLVSAETLNDRSKASLPIIVSLTSIPSRLHVIHLTVRSVLAGTHKPEKIVLWLHESLRSNIPKSLRKLIGNCFEIRYVSDDSPHLKLVHSVQFFSENLIVTCDDDLMYAPNWLNALYEEHLRHPSDIIANECRAIAYDESGKVLPYNYWHAEATKGASYAALLPLGYAGILYPPHCLHHDVCRADVYSKLAPKADDLWFKAMALLKSTATRRATMAVKKPIPIFNSQSVSLQATNVKQDGNRMQWEAIVDYYKIPAFPPFQLRKK